MNNLKPLWKYCEITTPPLSNETRLEVLELLLRLQMGLTLTPPKSKPMPGIGANCHELRLKDHKTRTERRIFYHIADRHIVILDEFKKETQRTPKRVIERCKGRLADYNTAIRKGSSHA